MSDLRMTEPTKYRKKPVVIEARQLGTDYDEDIDIMRWCQGQPIPFEESSEDQALFYIQTLEGRLFARPGDWIIQGVKGEFYPCKSDIFAALAHVGGADASPGEQEYESRSPDGDGPLQYEQGSVGRLGDGRDTPAEEAPNLLFAAAAREETVRTGAGSEPADSHTKLKGGGADASPAPTERKLIGKLGIALADFYAMVKGESPQLLEDDINAIRAQEAIVSVQRYFQEHPQDRTPTGWQDIASAKLGEVVLLIGPAWRHAFVGTPNGDRGACYIELGDGWQTYATHWMPLPPSPLAGRK